MPIAVVPLSSPLADKIAWTDECYPLVRAALQRDAQGAQLLTTLAEAVAAARAELRRSGVMAACRSCEIDDGGSCCGAGIEDRYDGLLLLINRLLGVRLPATRVVPDGCYFVSQTGCVLCLRHTICVSYLCSRIHRTVAPERLAELAAAEGQEQEMAFLLHDRLRRTVFDG